MIKHVDWTPEMIERFWGGMTETGLQERLSFAKGAAPFLVPLAQRYLTPGARCLDFGGGTGDLAEYLVDREIHAAVYEPGLGCEERIQERLGGKESFLGIARADEDESFDCVFCLEVVEHVHETLLPDFFSRLARVTREDGLLLMTCPNQEDLELDSCLCPTCGSFFHRWQHLRSIAPSTLVQWLQRAGFEKVWLGLIGFEVGQALLDYLDAQEALAVSGGRETVAEAAAPPAARTARGPWKAVARALGIGSVRDDGSAPVDDAADSPKGADEVDLRLGSEARIVLVARRTSTVKNIEAT